MTNTEQKNKKGFVTRSLEKIVAPVVLAGAMLFGGNTYAQQNPGNTDPLSQAKAEAIAALKESAKEETDKSSREFIIRDAIDNLAGQYTFTQQAQFNAKFGDASNSSLRLFYETNSNDRTTIGTDFKNDDVRLNFGYVDNAVSGVKTIRGTAAVYPTKDSFVGAGVEKITDLETRVSAFGGMTLDNLNFQATADTTGAWATVGRYDGKEFRVGASVGQNASGDFNASASYNDSSTWVYARWKPTLDVRVGFGDVDLGRTAVFTGVTDSGDNELVGDSSFPFDVGNFDLFKLYKTPLGKDEGKVAGLLQYREDKGDQFTATGAYRVGDAGPFKGLAVVGEGSYGLDRGNWGVSIGAGGAIGDNFLLRTRGAYDSETGWYFGIAAEVKF
ncbi:MAG: hypothetical protein ACP5NS_03960 [Candidatus Pacearchaeota archaeon]